MYKTPEQNKRIHALIGELGIDAETKAEIIYSVTRGKTSSAASISHADAYEIIKHLESIKSQRKLGIKEQPKQEQTPENRMRRKVLSIFHEMNWHTKEGTLDWKRINNFMERSSYLHKDLNSYTKQELPKLITQIENVLNSFYAKK